MRLQMLMTRWPWLAAMDNESEKKGKTKKSYIVT